jgi:glycosyltransferase involved in cell wall biosynthesis
LQVRIFVGKGVPGTKFSNAPDRSGVDVRILATLQRPVISTGRPVTLMFNPTLPYHLWRFRPDVLLVQGGMLPNNWLTWLYGKLTGTPTVWWSLGEVRRRQFRGLSAVYRRLVKWVERRSAAFAGYSSAAIEYFLAEGYPPQRCFNLVNVVDTQLAAQKLAETQAQVPELRRRLGLEGQRVVLFVGSLSELSETKGLDVLIRAFACLPASSQPIKLLVVGDGPCRQSAEQLADQLGMADRVQFTGAVYDDVSAYFQLGDLFVLPGTGGLAISEAMAHGLPVICSIGDGAEVDLIDPGQNGYFVPPNDVDALLETMTRALASPERLRQMGAHSLRIIRERANIDRYLNEMLSAIYCAAECGRRGGIHGR